MPERQPMFLPLATFAEEGFQCFSYAVSRKQCIMKFRFIRMSFTQQQFRKPSVVSFELFVAAASKLEHGKTALRLFPPLIIRQNSVLVTVLFHGALDQNRSVYVDDDEKWVDRLYPSRQQKLASHVERSS